MLIKLSFVKNLITFLQAGNLRSFKFLRALNLEKDYILVNLILTLTFQCCICGFFFLFFLFLSFNMHIFISAS